MLYQGRGRPTSHLKHTVPGENMCRLHRGENPAPKKLRLAGLPGPGKDGKPARRIGSLHSTPALRAPVRNLAETRQPQRSGAHRSDVPVLRFLGAASNQIRGRNSPRLVGLCSLSRARSSLPLVAWSSPGPKAGRSRNGKLPGDPVTLLGKEKSKESFTPDENPSSEMHIAQ